MFLVAQRSTLQNGRPGIRITNNFAVRLATGITTSITTSIAICLVAVAVTVPVGAQTSDASSGLVQVQVRTTAGTPLAGAQLRLGNDTRVTETNEDGLVSVRDIPPGGTWLHVRRIGYRPDSLLVLPRASRTPATVTLVRVAVDLAPVVVVGQTAALGPMRGFYQRQASTSGRFLTNADLVRFRHRTMTDVLRTIPGMRVVTRQQRNSMRSRGGNCAPVVWLDGQPLVSIDIDLDAFDPLSFDGIEIYGVASVPVEFQSSQRISSSCGTIVLWTRRGTARPSAPRRAKDAPSPAAEVVRMLEALTAFTAANVDVVAHADSAVLVHPQYPDSLFVAQDSGSLLAEFVVGTDGVVNMETFSVVTTTHAALIGPVWLAVQDQRFIPAVRHGQRVAQIVQLSFRFVPDATTRRNR